MNCLSCGGATAEVLNLGDMYLPDFVDPGEPRGDRCPLRLVLCGECTLLQLGDLVPRDAVINSHYGFLTGLNEQNRRDQAEIVASVLKIIPHPVHWLDIGCNDGTLLSSVPLTTWRTGSDPLLEFGQFADPAGEHMDTMQADYFNAAAFDHGEVDVVTSAAMFYAVPDPGAFTEGVRKVLMRDGVWVIQLNDALDMLRHNVIDTIIHEHVAYYSVLSLQSLMLRHGMEIFDVEHSIVKGGCLRFFIGHRGAHQVQASVVLALDAEWKAEISSPVTWQDWGESVLDELTRTGTFLAGSAVAGTPAYCAGAGNRGGTLVQLLGADAADLMPYAVERSPSKHGKIWTSAGIPIISEEQFRADNPEYLLVSPWFFRDGFVEREKDYLAAGGTMIFPLPRFELVTG